MINRRRALQGGSLLAASLFLAACGGSSGGQLSSAGQGAGHSDINAKPRDQVRDGGDLRFPLDYLPSNFNYNHFDGADVEGFLVETALMPNLFPSTQDGGFRLNPDYLTSAELTSTSPQVVTYTINPKAVWSDGTPITWRDFEAQWKALNGSNPAFLIASKTGYEDISSVARGRDDKQAVVTFARVFSEWQALFSLLYPVTTNSDPVAFNSSWVKKFQATAGPFKVTAFDQTAQTLTLSRNERWWGTPAKLDRIIFKVVDRSALADAMANNELDFYPIGSSVDLMRRAQTTPGAVIRESPERLYNQITFNGAPGAILSDVQLRQAIARGIDRHEIARRLIGQIVPQAFTLDNHIYAYGAAHYQDNSGVVAFDQAAANRELDALGWTRPAPTAIRVKNGRPLQLRQVGDAANPIGDLIDRTVADQLSQIGVGTTSIRLSSPQKNDAIHSGDFDLIGFGWQSTSTPFSSSRGLYAEPLGDAVQQNYGRIFSPEITALFEQGIRELDETKRADIGNKVDKLIWQEVHHLPLYPGTGAYAVRSTLANFGAPGFADIDFVNAGFVK
ncbi:ABC transporter family substrate-binding protein [Pseudonocardia spinosispora]|uniref:ABC transporter family substrate-binding protein n=1 Tax=Pseudonocardia spinosispora TaxID=103441 RepID=UPI0004079615|nr:ABC transporter family substrate-binding protein [Pseudonocardia spinosispora]